MLHACDNAPFSVVLRNIEQRIDILLLGHGGAAEVFRDEFGQRLTDKTGFARSRNAGDSGEAADGKLDVETMEILCALTDGAIDVPDLEAVADSDRRQPPTYVPNRNMVLLALGAALAEARGACDLFYGAQAQDEYGYWDCTQEFQERLNAVLALNRGRPVRIHAPFVTMKKAEIVRVGIALGVDFSLTWSCYRGGERPCGSCPTCVERTNAFEEAGIGDPLIG